MLQNEDRRWMWQALKLAEQGYTPPNPMVGCLIVKDGVLLGKGYHPYAGQPHAEVFALRESRENARGATAYVTLEPCSHQGRTPPCADALIAAGISRVVAAVADPNPKVSGRGFERLRAAGIEVTTGLLEKQARRVNEAFFLFHATGMPFVTLKAAMTLDGKTATRTGDSRWITSEAARAYSHQLRAQSGAVMIGVGTLLADDPALTARFDPPPPRQPLRVILDSQLRTPSSSQAITLARQNPETMPLLIATTNNSSSELERGLSGDGIEIARFPADSAGHVDPAAVMRFLGERNIISALVDGGGRLHASLLEAKLAQKILVFIAPKIVGGQNAPTPVEGIGTEFMANALNLKNQKVRRFGPDIAIEAYI